MTNAAGASNDFLFRFERNWKGLPDPQPSILGSVVLHASDTGLFAGSLTIPAGQAEILVKVSGTNSPVFGGNTKNRLHYHDLT